MIGFSGTRAGMTKPQLIRIAGFLNSGYTDITAASTATPQLHHGDCIGADAEVAMLAFYMDYEVVGHPPINVSKREFSLYTHIWREAKEYIPRNHDIVDDTKVLLAAPKSHEPEARSGTWATIRYAMEKKRGVRVVYPDGSVQVSRMGKLEWEGGRR